MRGKYKGGDDVTDSMGLLISILVRYPEVSAVNFDPWEQMIRFSFICSRVAEEKELNEFNIYLMDCIQSFNYLEGKDASIIDISYEVCDNLTLFEIKRDVGTLVQEEIALVVQVFYQYWQRNLVLDLNDALIEEEMLMQEEIIDHMLESVKGSENDKYLYAFREEGKVLVFNK